MLDQKAAEMFDHVQQGFAGLLYEDTAQQDSQGANITAEREFFGGVRGLGSQLRKTDLLVVGCP
jgi:hypothetical protein